EVSCVRLIFPGIGVRDVISERADRRRAWRDSRLFAANERGRVSSGDEAGGSRLDISLDARDLPGKEKVIAKFRLPGFAQHRRSVDVGVAMHHAEPPA